MQERLQKLMAQAGIASRRAAEEMITQGRVTVNGKVATLGEKADPATDDVRVDGTRLRIEVTRIYLMINKPMGIVTAVQAQEQEHRRTVRDLIPIEGHLYPVGRLDADSEGLVLMTNDGELAQKLTHPRYEHTKVYGVTLRGRISDEAVSIWRRGIMLDDGPTKPVEIIVLERNADLTELRVTMREGRKRQIRRIAATLGHPVTQLIRTQIGSLTLGTLKVGEWRYLTDHEVKELQSLAQSTPHRGRRLARPSSKPETTEGAKPEGRKRPERFEKKETETKPRRRTATRTKSSPRPANRSSKPSKISRKPRSRRER